METINTRELRNINGGMLVMPTAPAIPGLILVNAFTKWLQRG